MAMRGRGKGFGRVGVALACILAVLALLIPKSLVFPWRAEFVAVLIAAGLLGGVLCLLARQRVSAAALGAAAALAAMEGARPWIAERAVLAATQPNAALIERHFVVGYSDILAARRLVAAAHVGGIFLTRRNVEGRTAGAVAAEIAGLQALRTKSGLPKLIVAADQEGGPVAHLSPPLPKPPALASLAALPPGQQYAAARNFGRAQGMELRSVGVTMDLAPVVDLTPAADAKNLDFYTRIATRSISENPETVSTIAAGFAQGLLDAGITPTAKHFPGLARVATDTHLFGATLTTGPAVLAATDWVPFRNVLALPGAAVMLSHVALEKLDADVPSSQSKRIVQTLLRDTWHFDGIAITDDFTMGAVEQAGLCRAVERALNAGIDLLLVSWDTDKAYPALRCALQADAEGRLDHAMLRQSARRLDTLARP
jgi:beta-N-acetylhexosaminidase